MTGGIIQLSYNGSQDIYLTGKPEITFFKVVYRRHTPFAVESIEQSFPNSGNFGEEIVTNIEKLGDLMSKIYLQVELPKVDLIKNSDQWETSRASSKKNLDRIVYFFDLVKDYLDENIEIAKKIDMLLKAANIPLSSIEKTVSDTDFMNSLITKRDELINYINNSKDLLLINELSKIEASDILQIDIQILANNIIHEIDKRSVLESEKDSEKRIQLKKLIQKDFYQRIQPFYNSIYLTHLKAKNQYQTFLNNKYLERYPFAWIEELGHAIVDYVDIRIGGKQIDRQTGDWMIIYNQLFNSISQEDNYNKMIGNINELTEFNDNHKSAYKLMIPLQFWFCRNTGLALPLVSLRYHDIVLNLKFKDLSKLCHYDDRIDMDFANLQAKYGINLGNTKLLIDYIFLGNDERDRFAKASHEYLIETVQFNEFDGINGSSVNIHLNFNHSTKFMVWFAQPDSYRKNSEKIRFQWNDYTDGIGDTMESAYLRLNYTNRTDPMLDMKYFNLLQPFRHFKKTIVNGLYVYSFGLNPMEHQPSGCINMSRLDDVSLVIKFMDKYIKSINDSVYVGVYTVQYNVLRFMSGMAGVAFN